MEIRDWRGGQSKIVVGCLLQRGTPFCAVSQVIFTGWL